MNSGETTQDGDFGAHLSEDEKIDELQSMSSRFFELKFQNLIFRVAVANNFK